MSARQVFDVYGRLRVTAERRPDGSWALYQLTGDGKRRRLDDVVLPDDATPDDVVRGLEATYHEYARPGTSIERVEG